jgi:hypothetical protein
MYVGCRITFREFSIKRGANVFSLDWHRRGTWSKRLFTGLLDWLRRGVSVFVTIKNVVQTSYHLSLITGLAC